MSSSDLADEVWRVMASLVIDNRDGWKRAVVEQTGLPFSRIRILNRLGRQPMTVSGAHAAAMDAPATTVAVNDLENAGSWCARPIRPIGGGRLIDRGRPRDGSKIDAVADLRPVPGLARRQLKA
jgi:hypothetical protein